MEPHVDRHGGGGRLADWSRRFAGPTLTRGVFIVALALSLLVVGLNANDKYLEIKHAAQADLVSLNHMLVQGTRTSLDNRAVILRMVGEQLLRLGALDNPDAGRGFLDGVAGLDPGIAGYGLARPNGQLVMVSGTPANVPLPNLLKQEESRAGFEETLNARTLIPGRPYFLKTLGQWIIPMRLALRDGSGRVKAVMAAGFRIVGGNTYWSGLSYPEGIAGVVLRGKDHVQFSTRSDVSIDRAQAILGAHIPQAWIRLLDTLHGESCTVIFDPPDRTAGASDLMTGLSGPLLLTWERVSGRDLVAFTALELDRLRMDWVREVAPYGLGLLLLVVLGYGFYRFAERTRRRHERELVYLTNHDGLTGLMNMERLRDRLTQVMALSRGAGEPTLALVHMDVDNFQGMNATHGIATANAFLKTLAREVEGLLERGESLARVVGDEFALMVPLGEDEERGRTENRVLERILIRLSEPVRADGVDLRTSLSIGVAYYPTDATDPESLIRAASLASRAAKEQGRGEVVYFNPDMNSRAMRRSSIERALERALAHDALSVVYQPQIHSRSGRVAGLEALARWHDADLGFVSPMEFIPAAERCHTISELGFWVMDRALSDLRGLDGTWGGTRERDPTLSVNVSPLQLIARDFAECVERLLAKNGFPPERLILEVTESLMIHDMREVSRVLADLRALGVGLSIDDFGTGYSSLAYLRSLPLTELKIDKSFIMSKGDEDLSMVRAIIAMGKELDLTLVAEGVETEERADSLRGLGCDLLQGYLFSPPLPLDGLTTFVRDWARGIDHP